MDVIDHFGAMHHRNSAGRIRRVLRRCVLALACVAVGYVVAQVPEAGARAAITPACGTC